MRQRPRHFRLHGYLTAVAMLAAATLVAGLAGAADVRLYEVKVPLKGATAADRAAALAEATKAVAVRVSGRRDAAANGTITGADPARYVQRYAAGPDQTLTVGFEGAATERLLQQAGLPYWAAERPLTLVDVATDDRRTALEAAELRGLPIAWQAGASASGPGQAVLRGTPSGAQFDWSFTHLGETAQGRGTIADGIHLAADALAARYAPPSSRGTSDLVLRIKGAEDLRRYMSVLDYLESLSLVRRVEVEALQGEVLRLRVTVRGDRELFGRVAALESKLLPVARGADPAADVDFVFQP